MRGGEGLEGIGEGRLAHMMREHSSSVMRYSAALAKRMGLEVSEVAALGHVHQFGPMTLGAIRERLSMSAGAVTTLVDRLEGKGYVERVRNPADRRSYLVRCTKLGVEDSMQNLWPYVEEMISLEGRFSAEEKDVIERFLRATTEATNEHALKLVGGWSGAGDATTPANGGECR